MDSPQQAGLTEDHQQHQLSAASCLGQSFWTGTESRIVSKQQPASARLQKTLYQNQIRVGDAGVHLDAVVSLRRQAGLLIKLQQPCAVEQLSMHDGQSIHNGINTGVAVEKSHAQSNVLPFNRR
jgi:hypothetical protein